MAPAIRQPATHLRKCPDVMQPAKSASHRAQSHMENGFHTPGVCTNSCLATSPFYTKNHQLNLTFLFFHAVCGDNHNSQQSLSRKGCLSESQQDGVFIDEMAPKCVEFVWYLTNLLNYRQTVIQLKYFLGSNLENTRIKNMPLSSFCISYK